MGRGRGGFKEDYRGGKYYGNAIPKLPWNHWTQIGHPTVLVNNAGVVQGKLILDLTPEDIKQYASSSYVYASSHSAL